MRPAIHAKYLRTCGLHPPPPCLGAGGIGICGLCCPAQRSVRFFESFVENCYMRSAEGQRNAAPPHNPVRRSLRYVTGLRGCDHTAQNSKPRLSVAANKSCLQGRPFKIWSRAPAPYGNWNACLRSTYGWSYHCRPFLRQEPYIPIYPVQWPGNVKPSVSAS